MGAPIRKAIRAQPSRPGEGKEAAIQALEIAALGVTLGYGGLAAGSLAARTAGLRSGMSWVRHPIAKTVQLVYEGQRIGRVATIYLQASRGLRYANYAAFAMNPLATYHYLKGGEYDKAMIQYFGPIGSVWVYNKYQESQKVSLSSSKRSPQGKKKSTKKSKPKKMSAKQKKRLWRMGLRWCNKHRRYDKCSLRER